MMSIMDIFGWTGAFISICFLCSPLPNFIKLIKKKIQYKEIHILIILGNYISSIVWLIYGYKISWIWIYLIHMGKQKITLTLICAILLSALTFALYIILSIIIDDKDTLGEVCFIVCSLSYISPTQLLIKVLNKKDYRIIPIYSAIISSLGFGSWSIFGLFKFSATIIIPNLVGFIFSAIQIILYRVYKNKKPLDEEIGNISNSVIGAVKNVVERTVEIANNINQNNQNNANSNGGQNNQNASVEVKNVMGDNNNVNNSNNNENKINFDTANNNDKPKGNDIIGMNFNTNLEGNPGNNNNFNGIQNNVNINNNI